MVEEEIHSNEARTMYKGRPCPYEGASWISKITFWWLNPLLKTGSSKRLNTDDIYDVCSTDQASAVASRLERSWNEEVVVASERQRNPNLFKAIFHAFKGECLKFGIYLLISESMGILQPFFIGKILDYFQADSKLTPEEIYFVAAALVVSGLIRFIVEPWYFFLCQSLDIRLKAAVGCLMYRKILKISSSSLHETTSGKIVTHFATDLEKFNFASETFHYIWIAPVEVIITLYVIYQKVGVASLCMVPVFVCSVPFQAFIGRLHGSLRTKIGARTDRRIHVMNEIIAGMRVIKMYCWEKPFNRVIAQLRKTEVKQIWIASILRSLNFSIYLVSSRILGMVVFLAAWQMNIPLSTSIIFSVLGWIEMVRFIVFFCFTLLVERVVQLWASMKRIQSFLILDEIKNHSTSNGHNHMVYTSNTHAEDAIKINKMNAGLEWTSHGRSQIRADNEKNGKNQILRMEKEKEDMVQRFSLTDVNLNVKRGDFIAVVGAVGSGKSSLLMTLIGEIPVTEGHVTVNGTIGYVSQQPWVISGTFRDNIVFGQDENKSKYEKVIHVCDLGKDIEQMEYGDMTLVGERGLLLSGGQKARLTLARTLYKDYDIYLFDDPLGAVDTKVGKHIFNRCICEYLEGKTRILVTHQLQYLKTADKIVVLKEGCMVNIGTYEELTNTTSELFTFLSDPREEEGDNQKETLDTSSIIKTNSNKKHLDEEEDTQTGTVAWRVYTDYISAGFPSITVPLLLVLTTLTQGSMLVGDWYLALWGEFQDTLHVSGRALPSILRNGSSNCEGRRTCHVSNKSSENNSNIFMTNTTSAQPSGGGEFIQVYSVSVGVYILLAIMMSVVLQSTLNISGKRLHDRIFTKVIGAKTRFFDSRPVGDILNRFARDMGIMDDMIPRMVNVMFEIAFRILVMLVVTCVINPLLLIPLCPALIVIIAIRHYAIRTIRQLKRIEVSSRSPLFSHVSDTLHGLQSIRALDKTEDFMKEFDAYQDRHTIAGFLYRASFRWFSVKSVFAVGVYSMFVIVTSLVFKDALGITSGLFGLSLSYVFLVAAPFEFMSRQSTQLETYMTSVERITAYTKLEQEAEKTSNQPPPPSWPEAGQITFKNVSLKYSESSSLVLRDFNCTIKGTEKIGIVGRTGAGKSSVLAALLRLAEPEGSIIIDDVDILKIGLHELRAKISVIPQDPVLFSGTLRHNLDPFEEYSDETIWNSLQQVQLKNKVESIPGQLYAEMSEGGENFSVGQRQLVCLARAVLHNNKILFLDEATANVDHKTDEIIQHTIRQRFKDCTVLTIAHRLHTIMDSDRVMVLHNGHLKEFDAPLKLLHIKNGYFRGLVGKTGNEEELLQQSLVEASDKRISESEHL